MPVLDTDILTILQRRSEPQHARVVERLRSLSQPARIYVTIVSFEEQLRGWLEYVKRAKSAQLPRAYEKLAQLNDDFSRRALLLFTDDAARIYRHLLEAKTKVGKMDLRIAATVLAHDETLITANIRDFRRIPNLRVEDWTR